jgi:glycosyltransferase involved in cell wall biosynthesis
MSAATTPLSVAIVAPSRRNLGGQAIQAERLLANWREDPEVRAWLVPVNPEPPRLLRRLARIKYVRTVLTQLSYWPLLFRELRQADVVHVFSASYASFLLAPLPAVLVARLFGKPVVMNYRSGEAPDHLRRSAIARAVLSQVDLNVVPSAFLEKVFAEFGLKAQVVPNIVDLDRFAFRSRVPIRPRILSTRNFEGLYNVECTLRAFQLVQQRFPDATLTLVGSGSREGSLIRLASDLSLTNVQFVGAVAPQEVWRYYADADIYLQTPDIDNMPASVLEAFASGCVVVSTDAGGVPAVVTEGANGFMVSCGDAAGAAERVIELVENPEIAGRVTKAARAACERYRWSSVRPLWVSLYQHVVEARNALREPRESTVHS